MLEIIKIASILVLLVAAFLMSVLLLMYKANESDIDRKRRYVARFLPYVIFFQSFHVSKNRALVKKINSALLSMAITLVVLGLFYVGLHVDVLV